MATVNYPIVRFLQFPASCLRSNRSCANNALQLYGRKIGPDPASIASCRMGGILANNASGMCCGVVQNAYHTLQSLTFILPSGTQIDTADPNADNILRLLEPRLCETLLRLKT